MKHHYVRHAALLGLIAVSLCGCEDPPEIKPLEPLKKAESEATDSQQQTPTTTESQNWWQSLESLPFEAWYVQYAGGKRIGYYQTLIKPQEVADGIRIESRGLFSLKASPTSSNPTSYEFQLEALEDPQGNLARFTEVTYADDVESRIEGSMLGDRLTLKNTLPDGTSSKVSLAWQPGTWGVLGIQSMLLAEPMQPGDRRQCRILVPKLGQIIAVELVAGSPEITTLPGGATPSLIPIDVVMQSKEGQARSRNWITESGLIKKTLSFDPTISTFHAPRDVAERIRDEMLLSRQLSKTIPYQSAGPSNDAESVDYMVEGSGIDLFRLFDKTVRQQVKSLTALRTRVTVFRDPASVPGLSLTEPTAECLASSTMIPAQHASIDKLATELLSQEPANDRTGCDQALLLTEGLDKIMSDQPDRAELPNALETARKLEGDIKAQAVLLTALLRNREIPARLALGLKPAESGTQMKFHMWVEAWCGDSWLSLDPYHGSLAAMDCIKLTDTTLNGSNPYGEILQVYAAMDSIQVTREPKR